MIKPGQRWRLDTTYANIFEIKSIKEGSQKIENFGQGDQLTCTCESFRIEKQKKIVDNRCCFPVELEKNRYWTLLKNQTAPQNLESFS